MSKFGQLMNHLDLKNPKISKRDFPEGITPITPQDICVIQLKPYKINEKCENCAYAALINIKGHMNELGIGGYMSNQKDPLKSTIHRPTEGVKLREPHTMIVGFGEAWVCRNRKMGERNVFILTEESSPCEHCTPKSGVEEKKGK